jgi:hypothetical protein
VLARRQRAAFDGYRSHLGKGGEDGGFFGHLACPYRSGTAPERDDGRRRLIAGLDILAYDHRPRIIQIT